MQQHQPQSPAFNQDPLKNNTWSICYIHTLKEDPPALSPCSSSFIWTRRVFRSSCCCFRHSCWQAITQTPVPRFHKQLKIYSASFSFSFGFSFFFLFFNDYSNSSSITAFGGLPLGLAVHFELTMAWFSPIQTVNQPLLCALNLAPGLNWLVSVHGTWSRLFACQL